MRTEAHEVEERDEPPEADAGLSIRPGTAHASMRSR
jgi:hypothetical protein